MHEKEDSLKSYIKKYNLIFLESPASEENGIIF